MDDVEKKVMAFAQRCFDANIEKYGFSFVPTGIYKMGFKNDGELYENWQTRMKEYRPSITEHPLLYKSLRLYDKKSKEEGQ